MQAPVCSSGPERRAARKARYLAIQKELDELRARAWRYRSGNFLAEIRPAPVEDPELSSRLCGPRMMTLQWRRE